MLKDFLRQHRYHLTAMAVCLAVAACSGLYLVKSEPSATRQAAAVVGGEAGDLSSDIEWSQDDASATPHGPPLVRGGNAATPPGPSIEEKMGISTTPSSSPLCPPAGDLPKGEKGGEATATADVRVSLFIGDQQYSADIISGGTVYDLMTTLQNKGEFSFKSKEYAGLGQFIEEINGLANNPRQGQYWIYYINGQSADRGVSNYILKLNDIINWKYEKAEL